MLTFNDYGEILNIFRQYGLEKDEETRDLYIKIFVCYMNEFEKIKEKMMNDDTIESINIFLKHT